VPLSKLSKKAPKSVKAPLSAEAALENNTRMIGALMEFIQKTMTKNAAAFPMARTIRIGEASTFDDFPNILKVAKAVIDEKYEVSRLHDEDSGDDIDKLVHTMAKDQPKFDPSQVARESSQATGPDMNQLANEFQKMVLSLMSKSNANLALKPTIEADFDDPSAGIYVTISPELSSKC
jgi:hypothetical protein